jgi:glycosyltransferase involved in cell wall biosynthesis
MIFHIHFSCDLNTGDYRRVKNLENDFSRKMDSKTLEIVFCPIFNWLPYLFRNRVKLGDNVVRKFVFPQMPYGERFIISYFKDFYMSFMVFILVLIFRPNAILGEYTTSVNCLNLVNFIFPKVKLFIDIHGDIYEEYVCLNSKSNPYFKKRIEFMEKRILKICDLVIVQSHVMKKRLIYKYKTSEVNVDFDKIIVYKCGVDTDSFPFSEFYRNQLRKELKVNLDEILFVYSGSLHKWQNIDTCINVFEKFYKYKPNSKFLILTNEIFKLKKVLLKYNKRDFVQNILFKEVNHSVVFQYLSAADIGFLIREDNIMNAVAFPTKLAEYFSCGLPVISSRVAQNWVEDSKFILEYDSPQIVSNINRVALGLDRMEISYFAESYLSLESDRSNMDYILSNFNF